MHISPSHPLIALRRDPSFSPGNVQSDALILEAVAGCIEAQGYRVHTCDETELADMQEVPAAVFGMQRRADTLERLSQLEREGKTVVVNSSQGIANCGRSQMTSILDAHAIAQPEHWTQHTGQPFTGQCLPCWIKNGEGHSMTKDDVVYAESREAAEEALEKLRRRGVKEAVCFRHTEGDLVKFYGVVGTPFFHAYYPTATGGRSKFGLEAINGLPQGYAYDERQLQTLATKAAHAIGIDVYGGDCIVRKDGTVHIIDFNDWPSFSCCRDQAVPHIAARIISLIKDN